MYVNCKIVYYLFCGDSLYKMLLVHPQRRSQRQDKRKHVTSWPTCVLCVCVSRWNYLFCFD